VDLLNGKLKVKSTKEKGSVFTIDLKNLNYSEGMHTTGEPIQKKKYRKNYFGHCKVLIVDDIAENRQYLVGALRKTKIQVFEAKSGKEAIDLVKSESPDLIITDIIMPEMDGFELCKIIKTRYKNIKVIGNSAAVMSFKPKEIKNADFDAFLPKPIPLQDIYFTLAKFLPYSEIEEESEDVTAQIKKEDIPKLLNELEGPVTALWNELRLF
jgi:CheY-like chemotaxis protein